MSEIPKNSFRKLHRIDDRAYDDKGIKVPLTVNPKVSIMEQDLIAEKKLRLIIKRYIIENAVDLLFDIIGSDTLS